MVNWSDLHIDLLIKIVKQLNSYEDAIAFSAVCKTWRSAARKENLTSKSQQQVKVSWLPWLVQAGKQDSNFREFFSVPRDKFHEFWLPKAKGKRLLTSKGWLLILNNSGGHFKLLRPFSDKGKKISLPPFQYNEKLLVPTKAVLSCTNPSPTSDFMLMLCFNSETLALYTHSDLAWTNINTKNCTSFLDVTYYNGKFYIIDSVLKIFVVEYHIIRGRTSTTAKAILHSKLQFWTDYFIIPYLVEYSEALMVVLFKAFNFDTRSVHGCPQFEVFEMDMNSGRWKEVMNIGNKVVFLEKGSSFCVESRFNAKCIYFLRNSFHKSGVYNMRDGTVEPLLKDSVSDRDDFPCKLLWVQPSL